jgi:hypothetical protein
LVVIRSDINLHPLHDVGHGPAYFALWLCWPSNIDAFQIALVKPSWQQYDRADNADLSKNALPRHPANMCLMVVRSTSISRHNHAARFLYRAYERTAEPCSHSYAVMRISRRSGILTQQGNRVITKNLALAASITMLVAISGQALAGAVAPKARYWPTATDPSDRQVVRAFNAFDPAMATQTVDPNAHRYHGGPKSNY